MSKVCDFFEKLHNDPKAKELFDGLAVPDSFEETVKIYARAAGELGFDLTEEEIKEEIIALEKAQAEKNDQAADAIKDIPLDELDTVAGGTAIPSEACKDTYRDRENCWYNDGCDRANNKYKEYKCKNSDKGACIVFSS